MAMAGYTTIPSKIVAKKGRACILHDLGISVNDHDVVDLTTYEAEVLMKSSELKEFLKSGMIVAYEEGMDLPKPAKPFLTIPEMKTTIGGGVTSVKIGITEHKKHLAPSEYSYETPISEETIAEIGLANAKQRLARLKEQEELLAEEEELEARKKVYQTQVKPLPVISTVRVDGKEVAQEEWKAPESPKLKAIKESTQKTDLSGVIDSRKPE